jgi:hypothetical protein
MAPISLKTEYLYIIAKACLLHPVSAKWHTTENTDKDKRCSSPRNNHMKEGKEITYKGIYKRKKEIIIPLKI